VQKVKKKVVGLGELLWDVFPERSCLGGAPANFAYITTLMGDQGIVASRVGEDSRGVEALRRMAELKLDIEHVQTDASHPTGTVAVEIDEKGLPRYKIATSVAWDFLQWTPDWQALAESADAICFGSLAQRSEDSEKTIKRCLQAAEDALKVFDVNLRQSYYSPHLLAESMKLADIVKLNNEELPIVMKLTQLLHKDERSSAARLIDAYGLEVVCVTRGQHGSLLVHGSEATEHPGFCVKVADTVGSGDAFTAGLVHEFLHGAPLDRMNEVANLVGAWVASEVGGMPTPKRGALENSLAEIR